MRIVIFCHTAAMAGAELAIGESIRYLNSQGHLVYIVVPETGAFIEHVRPYIAGHTVIYQDHWTGMGKLTFWQKIKFLRGFYRSARALKNYLQRVNADIGLTNTSVIIAGAIGARWARIPHIWYLHEFVVEDHGLIWQYGEKTSYKLIDRLSTLVLVNSEVVRRKVEQFVTPAKIRFLYYANTIDWDPFLPEELPQAPILLMVGAIHVGKNQEFAIRALAEPALASLGAQLRIIGAGPEAEKQRLIALAHQLNIEDRVHFLSFSTDRRFVFSQGQALIVASRAEAFGRVTVEAQKSGLPVLAARAGASSELIEDGVSGLLFSLHSPASLAQQANRLLLDAELYQRIRTAALAMAEARYTEATHGAKLLNAIIEAQYLYGR
jgi:glycosyltransferase involved in cell wall biosynthesis